MKLWICLVRQEARVGGESQRCRHVNTDSSLIDTELVVACGEMVLIGGEPVEWCVKHSSPGWSNSIIDAEECYEVVCGDAAPGFDCLFESQVRVGP